MDVERLEWLLLNEEGGLVDYPIRVVKVRWKSMLNLSILFAIFTVNTRQKKRPNVVL